MHRSYEPDADRQLDEGSEPPEPCSHCGELLSGAEVCSCTEDVLPDDEVDDSWIERALDRYSR